ncbi:FRG domain-containing protein [Paenibacillus elgii]|uniref:FRG domain-containing protein n=1 Tax=Paenibacillus elgii TaxID=189691 RepID=UPI000248CEDC|nr:FRG domain-containing protein [Paenibacillus elgii]
MNIQDKKSLIIDLKARMNRAKKPIHYLHILNGLEKILPQSVVSMEAPNNIICPPAIKPPSTWRRLLRGFPIEEDTVSKLIDNDFIMLDIDLFLSKNKLEESIVSFIREMIGGKYFYLDSDYGIFLYSKFGKYHNFGLDRAMFERYHQIPYSKKELLLSIGSFRAQELFKNTLDFSKRDTVESVLELSVSSRDELTELISTLRPNLKGFDLCYRGQVFDYLTANFFEEAKRNITPWRGVQDISLVPSMYRNLKNKLGDYKDYSEYYLELAELSIYIESIIETRLPIELPSLILQHYGFESTILDITFDLDVALFFAQNRIRDNQYVPIDWKSTSKPVLYIFIMSEKADPILNSNQLIKGKNVLRPIRQKCGIMTGASLISRNYYSRYVALKVKLEKPVEYYYDAAYLFPGIEEDYLLKNIAEFIHEKQLKRIKPFILSK